MPLRIFKRGKIWHYAGVIDGQRLRGTTRTSDKGRAQRISAQVEEKFWKRRLDGPGADLTFANAAMLYRDAEKSTRFLAPIEDYWRDTLVSEITTGAIRQSAITLYPDCKGATRNRQVIVPTQAIINHAAEMDLCNKISVKRFPSETKIKQPVTGEWVDAFVEHASPHLGALCLFMYGTGARIGEAVELRWRDIDLDRRTALIRQTKVGDERIASLQTPLITAIANIPSNRNPDERVFQYQRRDSVDQPWRNTIRRAKITYLPRHSCRHGFATTMLHKGIDVVTVAKMGGWKDIATLVKTYGHAMTDPTVTDVIFDTNMTQSETANSVRLYKQREK